MHPRYSSLLKALLVYSSLQTISFPPPPISFTGLGYLSGLFLHESRREGEQVVAHPVTALVIEDSYHYPA